MGNTIAMLSAVQRGMILMHLYLLFLLQFSCVLTGIWKKEHHLTRKGICILALLGVTLVLFRVSSEKIRRVPAGYLNKTEKVISQMPVWLMGGILLLLTGITIYMILHAHRYYRTTLNRSAIKESVEYLPTGLCFFAEDGFVLLSNRKMEHLCLELTGKYLQDGNAFWRELTMEPPVVQAEPMRHGSARCFRLENGDIWTFEREILQMDKKSVIQLSAVNISELYQLSEQLERENAQLEEMNQRLRQYGKNMDAYVRSREILETKMRIHKEMGQALLSSWAYLTQKEEVMEKESVRTRWEYIILLLKKETEIMEDPGKWEQFVAAAEHAGVQIHVTGTLPDSRKQLELLMLAATEALTNAVRHGGADQLHVNLQSQKTMTAIFTNNGKKPNGPVTEGGGLGALRIRLEEAGGSMNVFAEPEFMLAVTLPGKGAEYDSDTGADCGRRSYDQNADGNLSEKQ